MIRQLVPVVLAKY